MEEKRGRRVWEKNVGERLRRRGRTRHPLLLRGDQAVRERVIHLHPPHSSAPTTRSPNETPARTPAPPRPCPHFCHCHSPYPKSATRRTLHSEIPTPSPDLPSERGAGGTGVRLFGALRGHILSNKSWPYSSKIMFLKGTFSHPALTTGATKQHPHRHPFSQLLPFTLAFLALGTLSLSTR